MWTGVINSDENLQAVVVGDCTILHSSTLAKSSKLYLHSWKDGRVFRLIIIPQTRAISSDTIALVDVHVLHSNCKVDHLRARLSALEYHRRG